MSILFWFDFKHLKNIYIKNKKKFMFNWIKLKNAKILSF